MTILRHLPNALTCCNLLCGFVAIILALQGELFHAGYFVGFALVFDFFDGFLARKLGVASPIGKDLDSLADMVTFGVAPGAVMFSLITISAWTDDSGERLLTMNEFTYSPIYLPAYFAALIPLFSCIRLANFNNDVRQGDSFFGLPTPANAMLICSLPFIAGIDKRCTGDPQHLWMLNTGFLCILTTFMSLLLVSGLPLFALKFANFSWRDNRVRFIFLALALVLLVLLRYSGIPLVILLYVLMSFVNNIFLKKPV